MVKPCRRDKSFSNNIQSNSVSWLVVLLFNYSFFGCYLFVYLFVLCLLCAWILTNIIFCPHTRPKRYFIDNPPSPTLSASPSWYHRWEKLKCPVTAKVLQLVNCRIRFQTQFPVASKPIGPYYFLLAKVEICVESVTGELRVIKRERSKWQLIIN